MSLPTGEAAAAAQTTFPFPFAVGTGGRITASGGDEAVRGKILQVLFTAPGERVNRPEFGCGLFNLVFEARNEVLRAATEFTVGQALSRWLRDDVLVEGVDVSAEGEDEVLVQVVYTRKRDLARQAVRIQFR
ncbi:MAG TPA: GPW/gp25 family protein [Longimicrobiaceae bacterium]|nr:GPW/gp25 family protein [Longimicrobiaceae bacterium]